MLTKGIFSFIIIIIIINKYLYTIKSYQKVVLN